MVTFRLVIFTGSARECRQGSPEVGLKWERPRDTAKSRAEAVQTLRDRLAAEIPAGHSSALEHLQNECPRAYVTMTDRSGIALTLASWAGNATHSYPLKHALYGKACAGTWTDRATGEVLQVGLGCMTSRPTY